MPVTPTPRQQMFLSLTCREALYGGAAGGGKSGALLLAALQYAHVPGYAALLLRRTYADLSLPDALMDRAHRWLAGTGAEWHDKTKTWRFPSGATLTFGYLEHERDKYRYQSSAFQFIGFDELTQFTETQYLYLFSRLRRLTSIDVPLRMRAASNPGNIGHDWVKRRFVPSHPVVEPVYWMTPDRAFVPARIEDNPHLDQAAYRAMLAELDSITRAQLLDGRWDVVHSVLFRREHIRIVDRAPDGLRWVRGYDLAASTRTSADYTASVACAIGPDGTVYLRDGWRMRVEWPDARRVMVETMRREPTALHVIEQALHGLAATQELLRDPAVAGIAIRSQSVDRDKYTRALPLAARAEQGKLALVDGTWVREWLDEALRFPDGEHDDYVDAATLAYAAAARANGSLMLFEVE